jgi:hypothetical protein
VAGEGKEVNAHGLDIYGMYARCLSCIEQEGDIADDLSYGIHILYGTADIGRMIQGYQAGIATE